MSPTLAISFFPTFLIVSFNLKEFSLKFFINHHLHYINSYYTSLITLFLYLVIYIIIYLHLIDTSSISSHKNNKLVERNYNYYHFDHSNHSSTFIINDRHHTSSVNQHNKNNFHSTLLQTSSLGHTVNIVATSTLPLIPIAQSTHYLQHPFVSILEDYLLVLQFTLLSSNFLIKSLTGRCH